MKKRFAIATLGCKTNSYESASIAATFSDDYTQVDFEDDAQVYVINSCTVTGRTDYKSRNLIRKALKKKAADPEVKVVVTGCFAQLNRDEILALGDVDLVVDNQHKTKIREYLDGSKHVFQSASEAKAFAYQAVDTMPEHSRAFQKIQDGCGLFCAYCAVSHARGPSRSASVSLVLDQARRFVQNGYREIVLAGVNLALYQDGEVDLAALLKMLKRIEGLKILRLSSLEPLFVTDRLIDEIADSNIVAPHFHFPLQSGSDAILKSMGRPYSAQDFQLLIQKVVSRIPDAAIGIDVITGFPGETAADFQSSYNLIASLPLAYLHVFPFSRRPHTKAFELSHQIPKEIKQARSKELLMLSKIKTQAYTNGLIDNKIKLRGVVERSSPQGSEILTDHYVRAVTPTPVTAGEIVELIPNKIIQDTVLCTSI